MPLCKNPYMAGTMPCPCRKCIPCLINRKRLWKHRILLESYLHPTSAFVTLTYTDERLYYRNDKTKEPTSLPSLRPRHLKNFLKKIRKAVHPTRLRFYGVGEYGDKSGRPHYHLALFGYEPCQRGGTRKDRHANGGSCCPPCDLLLKKWGHGGIDNAFLEPESAGYIAGYVTKKLTNPNDEKAQKILAGRHPEFARVSNRPGLALGIVDQLAIALNSPHGKYCLTEHGDVPLSLSLGKSTFPLGRYLRKKLREKLNLQEIIDPQTGEIKFAGQQKSLEAYKTELHTLLKTALADEEKEVLTLRQAILDRDGQTIRNIEVKHDLLKKGKTL